MAKRQASRFTFAGAALIRNLIRELQDHASERFCLRRGRNEGDLSAVKLLPESYAPTRIQVRSGLIERWSAAHRRVFDVFGGEASDRLRSLAPSPPR